MSTEVIGATILAICWVVSGWSYTLWDWHQRFDMTFADLLFCLLCGAGFGPTGWLMHIIEQPNKPTKPGRIIWRKRATDNHGSGA